MSESVRADCQPTSMKTPDEQPHPDLVPRELDDLPWHRQRNLLWHHTSTYSRQEVAALMPGWSARRCQRPPLPVSTSSTALFGDDGRYHLVQEGQLRCGHRRKRAKQEEPWKHEQDCTWWTDGDLYRVQPPRGAELEYTHLTWRWSVRTAGQLVPAAEILNGQRCPGWVLGGWPTWSGRKGRNGETRRRLIIELGDRCAVCGGDGQFMDHDPFTGLIRGLLCRYCNTNVDQCPHMSGCMFSDYLNNPPAWHLRLQYPDLGKTLRRTLDRAEAGEWNASDLADMRFGKRRN